MISAPKMDPQCVWDWFYRICAVPHGSGNTGALADLITRFAEDHRLSYTRDPAGNVILHKPASPGYENHPGVILQGHLDMVAVKDPDFPGDPERDGVHPVCRDGWVFAPGTSLGGDDGIAVAMALSVLEADHLTHPPLTVLLTNDEEIGMLGVTAADLSALTARRLINIDSEEEGVLTVCCAGGMMATVTLPLTRETRTGTALTLRLTHLSGGHSGVEIHKGRANANKLMASILRQCLTGLSAGIVDMSGGSKDNAIPTDAEARLIADPAQIPAWQTLIRALEAEMRDRYRETDPYLELSCEIGGTETADTLTAESARALLGLTADTKNGVIAYSEFDPSLVRTSLNLGILRTALEHAVLTWSVRSAVEQEKAELADHLSDMAAAAGASFTTSGAYSAWEYRQDSPLRDLLSAVWEEQTGHVPQVCGTHGGLECGPLCGMLPGLDAVSVGPEMEGVHTTAERLNVASVARIWRFLTAVLSRL